MKITVIAPIKKPPDKKNDSRAKVRDAYKGKECCTLLPAEFEFVFLDEGPQLLLNAYDSAYAAPDLIRKAIKAQADGADAIVINCTADTGLRACREAVSIPVFGPMESTFLYAAQFVDSYAVLTFTSAINGRFKRLARELNVSSRLAGVLSVEETGISGRCSTGADVANVLFAAISELYGKTRCDGFILGCTDFEGFGYALGCPGVEGVETMLKNRLQAEKIDVVFFKPFEIAVYQAYISVLMGMKSGSGSYPKPGVFF